MNLISCMLIAFSLRSGILDTRRMLDDGMKVGLGTGRLYCKYRYLDNSLKIITINMQTSLVAGYSPSVLNAVRTTVDSSKALGFTKADLEGYKVLDHHEALYMATLG